MYSASRIVLDARWWECVCVCVCQSVVSGKLVLILRISADTKVLSVSEKSRAARISTRPHSKYHMTTNKDDNIEQFPATLDIILAAYFNVCGEDNKNDSNSKPIKCSHCDL